MLCLRKKPKTFWLDFFKMGWLLTGQNIQHGNMWIFLVLYSIIVWSSL